uniref:Uncharacterized protein n=1 Tax=Ciona savignyi TaxID=51511 RepID=H2Y6X5_CIOSA
PASEDFDHTGETTVQTRSRPLSDHEQSKKKLDFGEFPQLHPHQ